MNDLIRRSALLEKQTYMFDEALGTSPCVLTEDIKAAPAVDAVEVVRCKDCRKRDTVNCPMEERYVEYPWQSTKHHDFCSYGERRSE